MSTFLKRYSFTILLLLIALLYLTRFTTLSAENAVRRAVFAEGYPFSACFLQARKATEGDFVDRVFASLPENENIYIVTSHVPKDFCTHALLRHWLVTETEGHYKAAYLPPAQHICSFSKRSAQSKRRYSKIKCCSANAESCCNTVSVAVAGSLRQIRLMLAPPCPRQNLPVKIHC